MERVVVEIFPFNVLLDEGLFDADAIKHVLLFLEGVQLELGSRVHQPFAAKRILTLAAYFRLLSDHLRKRL